jgi:anthranilate/para-aminobenzoate synthase component I
MTGAPKERTMAIIDAVECGARGVYSGTLGWFGVDGRAELSVVIRTLVHHGDHYRLGTGGGITVYSDPASEYAETQWKSEPLIRAVARASSASRSMLPSRVDG